MHICYMLAAIFCWYLKSNFFSNVISTDHIMQEKILHFYLNLTAGLRFRYNLLYIILLPQNNQFQICKFSVHTKHDMI